MQDISIEKLLIAVWMYVVAITFGTEIAKRWLWTPAWWLPIYSSWVIGLMAYATVVAVKFAPFSFVSVVLFMIITWAANGAYHLDLLKLKTALRWLFNINGGDK